MKYFLILLLTSYLHAENLTDLFPEPIPEPTPKVLQEVPKTPSKVIRKYTETSAKLNINFTSTSLAGIQIEEITAYRRVGNVIVGQITVPIELPNIAFNQIRTSVRFPIGLDTPE